MRLSVSRIRWRLALPSFLAAFCCGLYVGHVISAEANQRQYWNQDTITVKDLSGWGLSLNIAMQQWNNAGLGVQFQSTTGQKADIIVVSSPSKCHGSCAAVTNFLGYRPGSQQTIAMSRFPDLSEQRHATYWSVRVLVHELGHALGLPHHPGCRVMSENFARDCRIWDESKAFVCGPLRSDINEAKKIYGVASRHKIRTGCRY